MDDTIHPFFIFTLPLNEQATGRRDSFRGQILLAHYSWCGSVRSGPNALPVPLDCKSAPQLLRATTPLLFPVPCCSQPITSLGFAVGYMLFLTIRIFDS
jgi:hypothetical protein